VLQQVPDMTEEYNTLAAGLRGRFTGNPAKLLGPGAEEGEEEGGEGGEGGEEGGAPKKVRFSEAHRLAHAVASIEGECGLVPVGAFVATPTHHIVADPLFAGLSATDAADLSHYLHFRSPTHPVRAHALVKAAAVGAADFMDPASEDTPASVAWALRVDAARGQGAIRSLLWPGYFFWHDIETPRFGGGYFCDGQRNVRHHIQLKSRRLLPVGASSTQGTGAVSHYLGEGRGRSGGGG